MSKRKDSIALFEVISKAKQHEAALDVPGWVDKDGTPPPVPETGVVEQPPSPQPTPDPTPEPPADAGEEASEEAAPMEPIVVIEDGRLRITLNYLSAAVAVLGLLILLGGVYWLGRNAGRHSAAASLAPSGQQPPVASGHPGSESATPPAAAGADHGLTLESQKGKYFLIIERMQGKTHDDELDAIAIINYLKDNGVIATQAIVSDRYAIVSRSSFESPKGNDAIEFAKKIEDLGKKYIPPHGRAKYLFSQHDKKNELNPSFGKY